MVASNFTVNVPYFFFPALMSEQNEHTVQYFYIMIMLEFLHSERSQRSYAGNKLADWYMKTTSF